MKEDPDTVTAAAIRSFQEGSNKEESFRRLAEIHYPAVLGFFRRQRSSAGASQDLAQDTFVRMYQGLDGFRHDSSFRTWLFRIITNVYRNHLRYQNQLKRSASEMSLESLLESPRDNEARSVEEDEEQASPLDATLDHERLDVLADALERMPDKMRHAMMLHMHHDLKYREIAVVMKVPIESVKSHIYQARQRLRSELAGYYDIDL